MHTSGSRSSPSSWQMCSTRVIIISSESGLNLNLAHLDASGSMILQNTATYITKQRNLTFIHVYSNSMTKDKDIMWNLPHGAFQLRFLQMTTIQQQLIASKYFNKFFQDNFMKESRWSGTMYGPLWCMQILPINPNSSNVFYHHPQKTVGDIGITIIIRKRKNLKQNSYCQIKQEMTKESVPADIIT